MKSGNDYQPPVSQLLTYGSCLEVDQKSPNPHNERIIQEALAAGPGQESRRLLDQLKTTYRFERWPNYTEELGITSAHIPELILMATDEADEAEIESESPAVWAPVHAWRCLGFLKAESAIEPLLGLLKYEDDDWIREEVPWVLAMIGESAIAPASLYLASRKYEDFARASALMSLEYVAQLHPNRKATCIKKIGSQLADFQNNSISLNGFLVSALVKLEATDKANLIERAYASGNVDDSICGNWPMVQIDMGLADEDDFEPHELESEYQWVRDEPISPRQYQKPTGLELPTRQVKKKTSQAIGFGSSQTTGDKKKKKKR